MKSSQVRQKFFNFFRSKGHKQIPSASILNNYDENLMFTNAGMNQFKNIFLGTEEPNNLRIVNSQKCLRVSGKHNDLEEVGIDTYHHTFFEMLGNWSFGDYFKEEIIDWSFELLTVQYKIDKKDLYVTVFNGSKEDNISEDNETYNYWKKFFPEEKIIYCDKKDNFWEMGDYGPCGPCSEIHIDIRSQDEKNKIDARDLINKDHPHIIEIWNLVFIQYNRLNDGSLKKLSKKYIDTGMGLERLCMVLQKKRSTYETDIFESLISEIEKVSGLKYLEDDKVDKAIRVISDHTRAVVISIADGQHPSNIGSGYVIRRILRRAIRFGYTYLDIKSPFIYKLVSKVSKDLQNAYSNIKDENKIIESVIKDEESAFLKTLDQGIVLLNKLIKSSKNKIIQGQDAFKLYDTYGFPIDLTSLIAAESGFEIDINGFDENMKKQKERSTSKAKLKYHEWNNINGDLISKFVGYDKVKSKMNLIRYREVETENGINFHLVFDNTPFYGESGGQIGDTGFIESKSKDIIKIIDTIKDNDDIIHVTDTIPNNKDSTFKGVIDKERRSQIESNHTATHLLHLALKRTLGNHVEQRGSMISEESFRFDFSHQSKLSAEEINKVEDYVNSLIKESIDLVEDRSADYKEVIKNGAVGLFSEKYGDKVRTVKFNDSYELCGGTHVKNTIDVGSFKIISEGSQAFGIRRILATSSAEKILAENLKQKAIREKAELDEANKLLKKENESLNKIKVESMKKDIIKNIRLVNGVNVFLSELDLDLKSIKELCFMLSDQIDKLFIIILSKTNEKVFISCFISKDIVEEKELDASEIIKKLSPLIDGNGGGQSFFATAGGKNIDGIKSVISQSEKIISQI
ncbi:MAG: alanine--tRNA ligase [Pelagibacterales bacterium]|nr:alanine--tRNA ligase [Pelagibacterales bacterium]